MAALELYRRLVDPGGGYILDVGAHEGKHSQVMSQVLPVIALEPNPDKRPTDGHLPQISWVSCAVSDKPGIGVLRVDVNHDYMSTLEPTYPHLVTQHSTEYFRHVSCLMVPTLTLDNVIDVAGIPAFCKVDVEGHERAVFRGLSYPLPALSFEVHDFDPDKAREIMAMLGELGDYHYAYSRREDFQLEPLDLEHLDLFGDVYATLGGPLL